MANKEHQLWKDIKKRCYSKNNYSYKYYGGKGIEIYNEWKESFDSFVLYISSLDNYKGKGMSLDRIDNNKSYEPGNLRWVSKSDQCINRKKFKNNTSGHTGISYINRDKVFVARVQYKGKSKRIGGFKKIEDAIVARNKYIN
ncbi:MAG: hypothetical protein DRQ42_09900, partial [Gammaproteobacteria bacterium]